MLSEVLVLELQLETLELLSLSLREEEYSLFERQCVGGTAETGRRVSHDAEGEGVGTRDLSRMVSVLSVTKQTDKLTLEIVGENIQSLRKNLLSAFVAEKCLVWDDFFLAWTRGLFDPALRDAFLTRLLLSK